MNKREAVESWVWMVLNVVAFFTGLFVILSQSLSGGGQFHVVIAGLALCGPVIAKSAATMLSAARGGSPNE